MRLSRFAVVSLLAFPLLSSAQAPAARVPVSARDVALVVSAVAGASVDASEVSLPADLTAATANTNLRLLQAEATQPAAVRLKLACEGGGCLPFFALLHVHDQAEAVQVASQISLKLNHNLPIESRKGTAVQAGMRATLLLEDEHMRISLPVVLIDSGAPGTEVRVASLDRKQLYRGIVSDNQTVRGSLP